MNLQKIQKKLLKLLALSTSPNEAEAALAAEKCKELMKKYNIRTIDVEQATGKTDVVAVPVKGYKEQHTEWESKLAAAIAEPFDAKALIGHGVNEWYAVFVASKTDQVFIEHLYRNIRRDLSKRAKMVVKDLNGDKDVLINSYCFGASQRIYERLTEIYQRPSDSRELVVHKKDAIQQYIKDQFGNVQPESMSDPTIDLDAYYAEVQGSIYGSEVGLRRPLKQSKNRGLIS